LSCVPFVIRTPVSIKKEFKKIRNNKFREKKRERNRKVKEEEQGYIAVCTLKIQFSHQILGDLYTSNIMSCEHIKPLDFQYRSLPCLATYSSTKN